MGVLSIPGAVPHLIRTGEGSSSIGMVLLAMLAGYSLSGRRSRGWRIACGVVGFALVPAVLLTADSPEDAWAAILFAALSVTLALARAIPLRRARPPVPGQVESSIGSVSA